MMGLATACGNDPSPSADSADDTSGPQDGTSTGEASVDGTTTPVGTTAEGTTAADESTTGPQLPPEPPSYYQWEKVEIPGTVCGNGSQYKFFVNYSETSDDVMIIFEPGGGCWDFESCSGQTDLGAANPNGIDDHHLNGFLGVHTPLLNREYPTNPVADWNMVFIPYCTGDVHTGRAVTVYQDPAGIQPDLEYHHNGHDNVVAAVEWMNVQFPQVPRMLVTGCSAGGAGATANYYFIRTGMNIDKGYLLADSGPIFPDSTFSQPLHDEINGSWRVDEVLEEQPAFAEIMSDFGLINTVLADTFPEDRLGFAFFRRDFNYSRYSYERFYEPTPDKDEILAMWWDDTQKLMAQFDTRDNLSYYIPYWRAFNDSHCTMVGLTWDGTEIQEAGVDLGDYIDHVLDDQAPLQNWLESEQPSED
ncbi:pectin acetylesterase-family hydrolase [Paraliomyxa miuraensis]|uniref:pectin acetylesterase-family hydrolase n=1 Tax=Paraliomyxa miuraensis TaxID=376150 RepID=UPI00225A1974|nr:pectin acetylesterase-family hydrolase [Paraliomyxa miuraensis]MCX4245079.1 pectinacetylesterase family protein [Paraliomyxa miuraensis]